MLGARTIWALSRCYLLREHKTGCTSTVVMARSAQARDAARSMLGLDSFEKLLAWIQPYLGSCKWWTTLLYHDRGWVKVASSCLAFVSRLTANLNDDGSKLQVHRTSGMTSSTYYTYQVFVRREFSLQCSSPHASIYIQAWQQFDDIPVPSMWWLNYHHVSPHGYSRRKI